MNTINNFMSRTIEAGGKLTVKSALNPLLWFCAVVDIPIMAMLTVIYASIPLWLLISMFVLIAIPIACTMFSAIYLLFYDRDKLQSEDYQIRKQTLDIIGQKGDRDVIMGGLSATTLNPLKQKATRIGSGK